MKNITQLFILLACLYSCYPGNKENGKTENDSTIVLITKNAPELKDYYSFKSIPFRIANLGEIQYVDTALNLIHYRLQPKEYDTITIYSGRDNLEISHNYSSMDKVYYLLNRGDTVLITYTDKNIPYAKILNRSYNDNELNYNYLFLKHSPQPDTFTYFEAYTLSNISLIKSIPTMKAPEHLFRENLKEQIIYLDSLRENQLIPEEYYVYRKNIILSVQFLNKLDSIPKNSLFLSDSIYLKYDSLIFCDFYRSLLNKHMYDFLKPPFDPYNIPNSGKIQFDSIIYSPNYSKIIKRFVFQYLADNGPANLRNSTLNDNLQKMLTDYVTITGDSVTYHKLNKQFGLLRTDSLEISLKNTMGNITSLNKVLEKYRGKYVYVDFWATWCIPCRELLLDNAKLEKEYHDKNIEFISLAFNDDEKRWKKFISDSTHLFGTENYTITNTMSSRIIEEWGIRTIPRYMLFDEKGDIAILDAPRPNTKEIRNVFNKVLK
jgi:thiol-disulfide isomerase/thioredoxin